MKTLESCIFLVFFNHNTSLIISTNNEIAANALVDLQSINAEYNSNLSNTDTLVCQSNNLPIYPDIEAIIKVLQDPSKNGKSKVNKVKYTRIETLAKTLLENIKYEYPNSPIDKNMHHSKIPIVMCILQYRKQTVLSECMPVYHCHHVDGLLYSIDGNDNVRGELRKVLENY